MSRPRLFSVRLQKNERIRFFITTGEGKIIKSVLKLIHDENIKKSLRHNRVISIYTYISD